MTVTKQQQLEWLAEEFAVWPGFGGVPIRMSSVTIGDVNNGLGVAHHIRMEEWQQERDKMQKQQDNSFRKCGARPPIGGRVELWFGGSFAYNCEFICVRGRNYIVWNLDADRPDCADIMNSEFRPLRTEREKAIDEMMSLVMDGLMSHEMAKELVIKLHDAGYRKVNS